MSACPSLLRARKTTWLLPNADILSVTACAFPCASAPLILQATKANTSLRPSTSHAAVFSSSLPLLSRWACPSRPPSKCHPKLPAVSPTKLIARRELCMQRRILTVTAAWASARKSRLTSSPTSQRPPAPNSSNRPPRSPRTNPELHAAAAFRLPVLLAAGRRRREPGVFQWHSHRRPIPRILRDDSWLCSWVSLAVVAPASCRPAPPQSLQLLHRAMLMVVFPAPTLSNRS